MVLTEMQLHAIKFYADVYGKAVAKAMLKQNIKAKIIKIKLAGFANIKNAENRRRRFKVHPLVIALNVGSAA